MTAMLTAPPPPPAATAPPQAAPPQAVRATAPLNPYTAPSRIPTRIDMTHEDPPPVTGAVGVSMASAGTGDSTGVMNSIGLGPAPTPVVRVAAAKPTGRTNVSSGVMAGQIITKTQPVYPPIAKAAHVSGAVVLHAIISKTGTIQSLSVVSGPEMLRASAVAAVQAWRYRPYLLNNDPTEVETTITVNFSFGG